MADHDVLRGPGRPSLLDRLERWVADARVDQAALARARERGLRESAEQEMSLTGVLLDLVERRAPLAVRTASGRSHHGAVEVAGADFVGLRLASGPSALIAHAAVTSVLPGFGEPDVLGDRVATTDLRLPDLLTELATDREPVLIVTAGGGTVSGRLRAAGRDVVAVRVDGDPPTTAYVPTGAILEVIVG